MTLQWFLDGKAISPQIVDVVPSSGSPPPFTFSWDTTKFLDGSAVSDGSHVLHGLFLDSNLPDVYFLRTFSLSVLIYNHGSVPTNPGAQDVWTSAGQNGMIRVFPPNWPDKVHYPGGGGSPRNVGQPWPYNFNPPVMPSALDNPTPDLIGESITGQSIIEYSTAPYFNTSPGGGVWALQKNVEQGDPGTTSTGPYLAQLGICYGDGGRGDCEVSWASTWVEDPTGSAWYGVELAGRLIRMDHNGTITTIAGFTKDYSKLPYDALGRGGITESQYKSRMTLVGNFVNGNDLGTAMDLAFDPLDAGHKTIFVVKQEDSCILKVDMSTSPATITLFAGQDGSPGYTDGTLAASAFDFPTSIVIAKDGTMYIADTNNCVIRKIAASRTGSCVSTFLGTQASRPTTTAVQTSSPTTYSPTSAVNFADPSLVIVYPFTIRLTSNGDIVLLENMTAHFRRINLSGVNANKVTSIGWWGSNTGLPNPSLAPTFPPLAWTWMDVDTAGVLGRVDDIISAQILPNVSANYWRTKIDGSVGFFLTNGTPWSQCTSNLDITNDPIGHYGWAVAISKFESRFIGTGVATNGVNMIRVRQPNDAWSPLFPSTNQNANLPAVSSGKYVFSTGTVNGRKGLSVPWYPAAGDPGVVAVFPFNIRPSFWSILGNAGIGHLGVLSDGGSDMNSFDAIVAKFPSTTPGDAGDVALAAWIQAGMGGSVPRPEISGNDMRDLIYWIRWNSMVGAIGSGGPPRVAVQPGADDPDTGNYPTILSISASRVDATTITVNWTTNKPTIGFAACGSKAQQSSTNGAFYPCWSPIENFPTPSTNSTYQTAHSATITTCPAGLPLHYTAVAKDLAGNSVHGSDQTLPAYISPDGTQIDTLNSLTGVLYNGYGQWTFGPIQDTADRCGTAGAVW